MWKLSLLVEGPTKPLGDLCAWSIIIGPIAHCLKHLAKTSLFQCYFQFWEQLDLQLTSQVPAYGEIPCKTSLFQCYCHFTQMKGKND